MAKLGFRRVDEMIGRSDMLDMRPGIDHWKAKGLDYSQLLYHPEAPSRVGRRCMIAQDHGLEDALDAKLIDHARPAIDHGTPVEITLPIRNVHRTVGAMLSGEIARKYGSAGSNPAPSTASFQARPDRVWERFWPAASHSSWKAIRTTTSARGFQAAKSSFILPKRRPSNLSRIFWSATWFSTGHLGRSFLQRPRR